MKVTGDGKEWHTAFQKRTLEGERSKEEESAKEWKRTVISHLS